MGKDFLRTFAVQRLEPLTYDSLPCFLAPSDNRKLEDREFTGMCKDKIQGMTGNEADPGHKRGVRASPSLTHTRAFTPIYTHTHNTHTNMLTRMRFIRLNSLSFAFVTSLSRSDEQRVRCTASDPAHALRCCRL